MLDHYHLIDLLVEAGKEQEVKKICQQHGGTSLRDISEEQRTAVEQELVRLAQEAGIEAFSLPEPLSEPLNTHQPSLEEQSTCNLLSDAALEGNTDPPQSYDDPDIPCLSFKNRLETHGWAHNVKWKEIKDGLRSPKRLSQTTKGFSRLKPDVRTKLKDRGCYIMGISKDNTHKKSAIQFRSCITLDSDNSTTEFLRAIRQSPYLLCGHTTCSHTPDQPRYRIIVPLSRLVNSEEYEAVAKGIMREYGEENFDRCSAVFSQLMFYPVSPSDGEYIFFETDGELLDVDQYLLKLPKDLKPLKKVGNKKSPGEKPGAIGAFNRAYPIEEAIQTFLPDIYEYEAPRRYHLKEAKSSAGLVVYGEYAYSFHATDPAFGNLCSSFDLVRLHKYGDADQGVPAGTKIQDRPSQKKMIEFAEQDPKVQQELHRDDWMNPFLDDKDKFTFSFQSTEAILANDQKFAGFRWNELERRIENHGNLPWYRDHIEWTDTDEACMLSELEKSYGYCSSYWLNKALIVFTNRPENRFHPIKDFIESVSWDRQERLDTLLVDFLGAPDNAYTRAVTRKTFTAAVARIYEPGIKFDHMLVLNGKQGIGKSTLFSRMGGAWFSDSLTLTDMKYKAGAEKLRGKWILEISELNGLKTAEVETIKAFLSTQKDRYRPPYDKQAQDFLRSCIIVGTTNSEHGYLRDSTGNRRYWPVSVRKSERSPWELDEATVAQIWAEAKFRYDKGEKLYLEGELAEYAARHQKEMMEPEDREGLIQEYLDTLLPPDWDTMNRVDRRDFIKSKRKGTVRRDRVSAKEIACECFDFKDSDGYKKYQFIYAYMDSLSDTWRRPKTASGNDVRVDVPFYGKQTVYERILPSVPNKEEHAE